MTKSEPIQSRWLEVKLSGKFYDRGTREFWRELSEGEREALREEFMSVLDNHGDRDFWANHTNEEVEVLWLRSVEYRAREAALDKQTGFFQYRGQDRDWVRGVFAVALFLLFCLSLAALAEIVTTLIPGLGVDNSLCPPYCF